MHLAMHTIFAASRKEPLADVLERIHAAIIAADFGEPHVQFALADSRGVSSVDRVLKRFPTLERFTKSFQPNPAVAAVKAISNNASPGSSAETIDFAILVEIARGVPRSFPFHSIGIQFPLPAFSDGAEIPATLVHQLPPPGISVSDRWWVNGRMRSVSALMIVDADVAAKKLPPIPDSIAAVLAACGKVKKRVQVPLVSAPAQQRPTIDTAAPEIAASIRAAVADYRSRIAEIVESAHLPHDLPPNQEAFTAGVTAGPKKPELVRAFTPMGYDCRGESGTFTLRRRTPGNLTAELMLDVGTWSNLVLAIFRVLGMVNGAGFKATLFLPVSRRAAVGGQYPMGGPERFRQIVDNLAALVAELDRTFVPAIEAISGPAPDWYKPENCGIRCRGHCGPFPAAGVVMNAIAPVKPPSIVAANHNRPSAIASSFRIPAIPNSTR